MTKDINGNVVSLRTTEKITLEELLLKTLGILSDDEKKMTVYAGLIVLDTEAGIGHFNLMNTTAAYMIGLLEIAKVNLIDDIGPE